MSEFVICWYNPHSVARYEQEWFETQEEADGALAEWKTKYPWNTYKLAEVILVQEGDGRYPNPYGSSTYFPVAS